MTKAKNESERKRIIICHWEDLEYVEQIRDISAQYDEEGNEVKPKGIPDRIYRKIWKAYRDIKVELPYVMMVRCCGEYLYTADDELDEWWDSQNIRWKKKYEDNTQMQETIGEEE